MSLTRQAVMMMMMVVMMVIANSLMALPVGAVLEALCTRTRLMFTTLSVGTVTIFTLQKAIEGKCV